MSYALAGVYLETLLDRLVDFGEWLFQDEGISWVIKSLAGKHMLWSKRMTLDAPVNSLMSSMVSG